VTRAEACIPVLQELNPHVEVKAISSLAPADCANYTVSVFTENLNGFAHIV
jgi:molybdopterin/thiamine biosynthesis adenylyltransferase